MKPDILKLDSRRRCTLTRFGRAEHTKYWVTELGDGTIFLTPLDILDPAAARPEARTADEVKQRLAPYLGL